MKKWTIRRKLASDGRRSEFFIGRLAFLEYSDFQQPPQESFGEIIWFTLATTYWENLLVG